MDSTLSSTESTKLTGGQRILEAGLIFTTVFSIYLIIALLSFDPADPGWSQTAYQISVKNAGGAFGAYISDVLFFVFGKVAYSLPFVLAILGWLMFQRIYDVLKVDFFTLGLKFIGFIMFYIGLTSIASMNFDNIYEFSAGGLVGDVISTSLLPYLNFIGSSLLYLVLTFSGIVLLTGWSLLKGIDSLGAYSIKAVTWCWEYCGELKEKFSSAPVKTVSEKTIKSKTKPKTNAKLEDKSKEGKLIKAPDVAEDISLQDSVVNNAIEDIYPQDEVDFTSGFSISDDVTEQTSIEINETSEVDLAAQFFGHIDNAPTSQPYVDDVKSKDIKVNDANVKESEFANFSDEDGLSNVNLEDVNLEGISPEDGIFISNDQFVDIEDLVDEPIVIGIEDDVSESALDAAFTNVEPINVPDDAQPSPPVPEKSTIDSPFERYKGMPTIDLLDKPNRTKNPISREELDQVSRLVEAKLLDYGVQAQVVDVLPGPVITRFELDLAPGIKVSKISNLSKDLARALSAASVRVVEVIPGKSVIGLEIPNKYREMVQLSEVIECDAFKNSDSSLAMVIGKDIAGEPIVADLAKMPHLLVAGTTGSGKSVVVNVMIISMLYKSTPDDVRFIMIDPKMLELSIYEGIPHLLSEVVTDMKDAANALRWCVGEMERRYKLMSAVGVRNLKGYNLKVKQAIEAGEPLTDPLWKPGDNMLDSAPLLEKLPSIVVVVDEFADMIMIVGKKVEELIARIAQKARAAGIHLILATQRPSVDVITGLIKANIPTRMALTVSSRVDSRTILDQQGAEQLLGHGDMLYLPQGTSIPTRAQGAFVDDHEVHAVVNDWKARGKPNYIEEILSGETTEDTLLPGEVAESSEEEMDVLYDEALAFVTESRRASISGVQRKFRIGYNRAARIIEQMEASGVVSSPGHNGNREVIAPPPVKN